MDGSSGMGDAKRRLTRTRKLIQEHPWCRFCGGDTPATSTDHQPPRSVFLGRVAPEGYEFPACTACNTGSTNADRLFALMTRLNPTGYRSKADRKEFKKLIAGINQYKPGLVNGILPPASLKKRVVRDLGLPLPPSIAAGEAPIVTLGEHWRGAVEAVLQKLGRALHYHHTSKIIPHDGTIDVTVFDSGSILSGRYDKSLGDILPAHRTTGRARVDLGDQFSYRYGVTADGLHSIFECQFNMQMVAMIQPSCEPLSNEDDSDEDLNPTVG